ncbi:putative alcohol dehydrogenase superfamily zinc-containing [Diplodia seriata]|uniref:Putative alcohol dehydrogenase superfamily zinc-containing n=1 Tax=Diplodia seriata TaxID=420778 RepID=A0A0G2EN81_9PEZI|nr:putative alcohol dehydrogenase superfamily zinc-containing [Diplodia seriata]
MVVSRSIRASDTVIQAGPGSKFAVGGRITGCTQCSIGLPPHFGTYQDHFLAPDAMAWRLPDDNDDDDDDDSSSLLSLDHVACLAVFNLLRYPLPWLSSPSIGMACFGWPVGMLFDAYETEVQ